MSLNKNLFFAAIFAYVCCVATIKNVSAKTLMVNVPKVGKIEGSFNNSVWTNQTYMQFLGIPYAESPSGGLRFKAPVPKRPWKNVLNATQFGQRCPNLAYLLSLSAEELNKDLEDCLNLCVYTKNLKGKLPVIFYIHGGGLNDGGAFKIKTGFFMDKDVVMVVPHYRLGQLGFMSTQTADIPGNMAVLDLILALEWVQRNIQHFGGDPNRVTISGQSAGSMLVNALAISPIVPKGYFHRGIMASGSLLAPMTYNNKSMETAVSVCHQIGCNGCYNVESINKCLAQANLKRLLQTKLNSFMQFTFTLDDFYGVLPNTPKQLAQQNKQKYPIMASVSKHDGSGFFAGIFYQLNTTNMNLTQVCRAITTALSGDEQLTETQFKNLMNFIFTPAQIKDRNFTRLLPGLVDLSSILSFKLPTMEFLAINNENTSNSNFISTFDYRGEFTKFKIPQLLKIYPFKNGVHHADEIFMLFNYEVLNDEDTKAAKVMIELWTSFAATGIPSMPNQPRIQPIRKGQNGPYFHISTQITVDDDFSDEYLVTVNDPDSPYRSAKMHMK